VHIASLNKGIDNPGVYALTAGVAYGGVGVWQEKQYGYYRPGWSSFLDPTGLFDVWEADLADPELELLPVERSEDGIEIIGDDFVWAKFGDQSTLIHMGSVSPSEAFVADVGVLPKGYGGGMLSYVHGASAGAALLGRKRASYKGGSTAERLARNDNWAEWFRWSLHTVWLEDEDGDLTLSGRIVDPIRAAIPVFDGRTPAAVKVAVLGDIPAGDVLSADMSYVREFIVEPSGVEVAVTLGGSGADVLQSALETIPLNGIGYREQGVFTGVWEDDLEVEFHHGRGSITTFTAASPAELWLEEVDAVVYRRLGGTLTVDFATPVTAMLTEPYVHWTRYYDPAHGDGTGYSQSFLRTRNLVVDLIGNQAGLSPGPAALPAGSTLRYHISVD
jgi:hypothetical protein